MNILVIRFRQLGDAILATPLLNTLHATFPEAHIDLVLNAHIAPLFEDHPALHRIITFTDDERHHMLTYLRKVWRTVHHTRYDVIIDMRSTLNTQPFALFSLQTPFRVAVRKAYTPCASNHLLPSGQRKSNGRPQHRPGHALASPPPPRGRPAHTLPHAPAAWLSYAAVSRPHGHRPHQA
jgi:heptosyltransferase-2